MWGPPKAHLGCLFCPAVRHVAKGRDGNRLDGRNRPGEFVDRDEARWALRRLFLASDFDELRHFQKE